MPLNERNTRHFHRTLYGGQLERITILKRGDDQQQGTVTPLIIFQCWKGEITKTGETLQGDMVVDHRTTWHIPKCELQRVGINYLNALDRIVDRKGRTWQPEATTSLEAKCFENHINVDCLRLS